MSGSSSPTSGSYSGIIAGTIVLPSGTVDTVVYANAVFGNGGAAVLQGPGTLDSSGYAHVNHNGGNVQLVLDTGIVWQNAGTVYQDGALQFGAAAGDSASIVNQAGAIYDLTTGDSQIYATNAGTYGFVNAGLLEMTGGGNNTVQVPLTNSGMVSADNGNFYLSGPVLNTGTLQSNGGFLEVHGGQLGGTIQALSNAVGLVGTFAAVIGTPETVVFAGANLGWGGDGAATLIGPGTILSLGSVNVSHYGGNLQLVLTGGITLENAGILEQIGAVQLGTAAADSATIVNQAGAIYDLATGDSQLYAANPGTYSFINAGLLEMIGGGGNTLQMPLSNSGTVSADNGNLYISKLASNTGTLRSNGGFLEIQGGVLGGTIAAVGNNVGLVGAYTLSSPVDAVEFLGANLGWFGDGVAIISGPGTLSNPGSVNVTHWGGNVQMELTGSVTWDNTGFINQNGLLLFGTAAGDTATIVNEAGATYDLSSGDSQLGIAGAGTYRFVNAGLLEMTGGGGNTVVVPLDNSGLVSANNGNFYLAGSISNTGTLQANNAYLEIDGGTLGGTIQSINGGRIVLQGTYTVAGPTNVVFGGASFGNGPSATVSGAGTLVSYGLVYVNHYGGNLQLQLGGGLTWENTGSFNQNGLLQLGAGAGDSATIINDAGAIYELSSGDAQLVTNGLGNYRFLNSGLLVMDGDGANTVSAAIVNTDLVSSRNGSLVLAGDVRNSGTLQADNGNLLVQGGTLGGTIENISTNGAQVTLIGTYGVAANATDTVTFHNVLLGNGNLATFAGPGTLLSNGYVVVNQYGGYTQLQLTGGITWENTATINQNGVVQFNAAAGSGATIINDANAIYELTSGNAQIAAGGTGSYMFDNAGTLEMVGGGDISISVMLDNTGLVTANNGNLRVGAGFSNTGTMQADGGFLWLYGGMLGGTIGVDPANGGAVAMQGTYQVASGLGQSVTFSGATFGDGSAAFLAGPGALTTEGSLNVNQYGGYAQLYLANGIVWQNAATVNQNGALEFGSATGDTATLVNQAGATYQLTSGNAQIYANGGGAYNFINDGTLQMTGGGGDHIAVALTNAGLITANNGVLYFDAPIANTGTLLTQGGGMQLSGGTLGGSMLATNGGITLLGLYSVASGSTDTVAFSNVVIGNGSVGTLAGQGTLASTGLITVNQYGGYTQLQIMGGITWANAGTINQNGVVLFGNIAGDSGTIVNQAGAVYELTSSNAQINTGATGTYAFVNAGLLEMTGGGTDSIWAAVDETASGTITAANGSLNFDAGATIGGAVNGGAQVNFNGGAVVLKATGNVTTNSVNVNAGTLYMAGGTINSPNLYLATGVEVIGDGAIGDLQSNALIDAAGGLLTVNGNISGTGTLQVESGATLELTGNTGQAVIVNGINATLKLDSQPVFSGIIQGFSGGDTIDLTGITLSAVSFGSGQLIGTIAGGGTLALSTPGVDTGLQLKLGTDASGASTIYLLPASVSAVPAILTALGPNNGILLADAHVGTPSHQALKIGNTATVPADGLSVSIGPTLGKAFATGSIAALAPGATDSTSIALGLQANSAGAKTGAVSLTFQSNGSVSGTVAALGTETLNLAGKVYRYAAPNATAPANVILHVGDGGGTVTESLAIANLAPADGFSEGLDAAATGTITGNLLSAAGATPDVAAGGSSNAVHVSFSTANAGTISGTVALTGSSDGTGIDSLGTTVLGTVDVAVAATINNYATLGIQQASGPGTLTSAGDTYTLDLGSVMQGAAHPVDTVSLANIATGPADWIVGTSTASGGPAFTITGLGTGTLQAGGSAPLSVDLSTVNAGVFTQTVTLSGTDANAAGFSQVLAGKTLVVTGTVQPNMQLAQATINEPSPIVLPDVHVASPIANDQTTVSITNTGSSALSGSVISASGAAFGRGAFSGLASGATDSSSIIAGLNNTSAGAKTGSVSISFGSGMSAAGTSVAIAGLFPTGVDGTDAALSGGAADPHYSADTGSAVVLSSGNLYGAWTEPGTGQWVNYTDNMATSGTHTFSTSFDLTGLNPATAELTIIYTTDNASTMFLNGTAVAALDSNAFASLHTVDITTGFVSGLNTLSFSVGEDGTDGLLISQISGTADPLAGVVLPTQTIALTGNVYRYAAPSITGPANAIVHIGDGGGTATAALNVSNTAPVDGFSEGLDATSLGVISGALSKAAGSTGEIAAGASNTAALQFGFSTANAETITGTIAVQEVSDGTGIDSLGTTMLGTVDVPVSITVNNYATAALQQSSGPGTLVHSGSVYTLDLGSIAQDTSDVIAGLNIANTATGPADWLTGTMSRNGDAEISAYNGPASGALGITWFEVGSTGNGPDFGGGGAPNMTLGTTLGPDGMPVATSPAGIADVNATTGEITWWDPALNSGIVQTGVGTVPVPFGSNMYAPNNTGPNDASYFETAILRGSFFLSTPQSVQFQIGSDDDSFVYIDGTLVDSSPGIHGANTHNFTVDGLAAGDHTIEIFYADRQQSGANLNFNVLTPGVVVTPIGAGAQTLGTIAAGTSTPLSITMSSATAGVFMQTLTLAPTDGNASGYAAAMNAQTLVVTGTVIPNPNLAHPALNTPNPILLADAHTASVANDQTLLSISNAGSAILTGFVSRATGNAYGSGSIDQLGSGATDSSSIVAGLDNTTAGAKSGTITLGFQSNSGNLLGNCSFENATSFVSQGQDTMQPAPGSTVMQGWTVVGSIPLSWIGPRNPFGVSAANGQYYLDLTGYTDHAPYAGVSQTIATVAGASYQLTFELGSASQYGLPASVTASADSTSQTFTSTLGGTNNWQLETLNFTATGTTTTISLVGAAGDRYIGVDDVRVTAAGTPAPLSLNPQTVSISGNVYRLASAAFSAPTNVYLHVGDGGGSYSEALAVTNTAPADAYSENLVATAVGSAGGAMSGVSGATGDIAPDTTNTGSITVTFSTATASLGGQAAVALVSDGTGIDSLGTTSLGTIDVPVSIAIDNHATAAIEFAGGNGTLMPTGVANTYTLDLGSTQQYSGALAARLGALNSAAGPAADQLNGTFGISGDSQFGNTGFDDFTGVNFGNAETNPVVSLDTSKIGTFTETIVLHPQGSNPSGFSETLQDETIDVVGTIVAPPPPPPPPLPVATAWGDVHITTFSGLYYDFQAEGEFVLARATDAGNPFQVQARLQPWSTGSTVSVITMLAAQSGTDRITFGLDRGSPVWLNGSALTLGGPGTSVALSGGGKLTELTGTSYQLTWSTGETMNVTLADSYINTSLTLSSSDGPGSVQGLLGSDTGTANDFQLADGTVLAQPMDSSTLYGAFASAWRVTDGTSLMDYVAGQNTATFTDKNFPSDAIGVSNLPAAIQEVARQQVIQAGITDPNQQQAAIIDLLVTGDPNALLNDLNVHQTGVKTVAAVINTPPPPVPAIGVSAVANNQVEAIAGTTPVTFTAYLTNATGTDTVVDWAVTAPGAGYLDATAFGGTLPSGFVIIPAGQTSANFTVDVPASVLGTQPSANVQVTISATNGDPIFGRTAQTEIDNNQPVAGNPAIPQLTLLSGTGTFGGAAGNYTLNLGTLVVGEPALQSRFQIGNVALVPADLLGGTITDTGSGGFIVYGDQPRTPLSAGAVFQGLVVTTNSDAPAGPQSETIVFTPVDENITGYSSILPAQTITITDTVLASANGVLNTTGPINLGTFYQNDVASTALSISNTASTGSAALDVSASVGSGDAKAAGSISTLAAGGTENAGIFAGIDASSPGVKTGTVALHYTSDAGSGNTADAGNAQIQVTGTVYGPATAYLAAAPIYVHRGDNGGSATTTITVSNTAPANGYAENLQAQIAGFGPIVTNASGSVEVAPGQSNLSALTATFSTTNLGSYSGTVAVALQSDGTGIDSHGTTSLGTAYVQATINVNQYAVAAIEEISGNGTLTPTGVALNYVLNLGTVAQFATPLGANLGVLNDVLGASDLLAGSFSIAGAPQFQNTGFVPFQNLAAQQTDSNPVVVLSTGTVGTFTETVTLNPTGYNPSGYSGTLAPETLTITGTVVAAPRPIPPSRVATGWGDVHLTTFDGLYYDFQGEGEFVLSRSTVAGDTFQVQARMQPWSPGASVSVNTEIAAQVGTDRVTFATGRANTVWIDGVASTLSPTDQIVILASGTLEELSATSYRLIWNTGEEIDVSNSGSYLNVNVSLPGGGAGKVQGLLGNDDGNALNDLQLANGTLLGQPTTYSTLYGEYANAWRVSDATSLMDYGPGQNTASFADTNFPYSQVSLGNLPADLYARALAAVQAAGITDPNLINAAIIDYAVTGNLNAITNSVNVQQRQGTNNTTGTQITPAATVVASVGVTANSATVVESTSGPKAIGFTVYLTSPEAADTAINYAVTSPGPGYLTAADFGGMAPAGRVTITAGQTTALFTVALPANVLGGMPTENLQVTIAPEGGEGVFAPVAQTAILNTGPTAGNPAQPIIEGLSGHGDLSGSGTTYILNLGTVLQFGNPLEAGWGVLNNATVPADLLSGSFVVNGSTQFLNSGLNAFAPLAAGQADTAPVVEMLTNQVGTFSETVTLSPRDSNATGYTAAQNDVTLTVTGTVLAPPPPSPPPVPVATAWGDVHITTFDGLYYNFQAAGEFVLSKSTLAGDSFQVQGRLQPWSAGAPVSVLTQLAAEIGTDSVTFGLGRTDAVYLDGTAYTFSGGTTLTLSGGTVQQISAHEYRVNWSTGETMTVSLSGSYINDTIALTAADANHVQGLLGPDSGNPANDLQLADGTPLLTSSGTISSSQLYGPYANAWRVTDATSLLNYGNGQTTATFTDTNFPSDVLQLDSLPASVVAAAEQVVRAAGITDPNLIEAAVIDLLVTGNPSAVFGSANVQQSGVILSGAAVSNPLPLPNVGIVAKSASVVETTTGTLAVSFTVYLTAAEASATTIQYQVTDPGANYLGLADIVGGTGSGSVQIAAGQTSADITIEVLANALGSQPSSNLQVTITPTGGEPVVGGSAQTLITNPSPTAGNPAKPLVEQLSGNGTLTGSGTQYVLNLGTAVQNGGALFANLGIANDATIPADDLAGLFTISNFAQFLNTGFDPFSNVAVGAADRSPVLALKTDTIGTFTETIDVAPQDTNATGYSQVLNDITITVTGTIVAPPPPPPPPVATATAFGDVHMTTFSGLYYDFQAVGEFTLAKSTVAGDSFDVQIRTRQWSPGATVSVTSQVAAGIGSDRVTFGLDRANSVWLDGAAYTFNGSSTLTLSGGTVQQLSSSSYVVTWNTGESLTVDLGGSYINSTVALSHTDGMGSVQGLLGSNSGVNSDFEPVVSGTTITTTQLYGAFADTWRLTQPTSLLDYSSGETTATFTNKGFPANAVGFNDLPTTLQQQGLQAAIQAGITDPNLQRAAALDLLVTGDPNMVVGGQNVQQQGITTTNAAVGAATLTPAVGVSANNAALTEPASGNLAVGFTVYLTQAETAVATFNYTVSAPGAGYLGASAFGGVLPSGTVTIVAGQTSAQFTVSLPAGALGSLPDSALQVSITPQGTESVFAPVAQTTVINNTIEPGTPADPIFALLSGGGVLNASGTNYVLNLGTFALNQHVQALSLALENTVAVPGNDLAGILSAGTVPGFTVSGAGPLPVIAAGNSYQGLHVRVDTSTTGSFSQTITLTPVDQNPSGYSSKLATETLTITDTVATGYATPSAIAPNPVDFGNRHVGDTISQSLTIGNTSATGAENLDAVIGTPTGNVTASGTITGLAAGSIDSSSLTVGLTAGSDGVRSGSAVVALSSVGTGIDANGITQLASQTITATGTLYNYATAGAVTPNAIDFGNVHTGTATLTLTISNIAAADGFAENLDAAVASNTGVVQATGSVTALGAGSSDASHIQLAFTGSADGKHTGSTVLSFVSDGNAVDNLGTTTLQSQTITAAGTVYNYATATATPASIDFGRQHVGVVLNQALTITNTGIADGFTENLDAGFGTTSGAVSASGSVAAMAASKTDSGSMVVHLSNTTDGVHSGTATLQLISDGGTIDGLGTTALQSQTIAVTGTLFNIATASAAATNPIGFGNRHVGDTIIQALTIANTGAADGFTENLDASFSGKTGAATATGSIQALGASKSDTHTLVVGLSSTNEGAQSGHATLALTSDGASIDGLGTTALTAQTIAVGGTLWAFAAPSMSTGTLDLGVTRVGGSLGSQSLSIHNGSSADPFQENLAYNLSGLANGITVAAGGSGVVVSGGSAAASVALNTGVAGNYTGSTATLHLTSTGTNTSGLADTTLNSSTITLNGKVYASATASAAGSLNFGVVHAGDAVTKSLSITNTVTGALADVLIGSAGSITSSAFGASGNLGAGIAAGGTGTLNFGLATTNSGVFTGSASLALASHDADLTDIAVTTGAVSLSGTVDNYATAALERIGRAGVTQLANGQTIDLGSLVAGSTPMTLNLGVINAATGLADLLSGSISAVGSSAFINAGSASVAALGAGQDQRGYSVALVPNSAPGVVSEVVTLHAAGSNASGYNAALTDQTLTITGTIHGVCWSQDLSGDWSDTSKWNIEALPGTSDDVMINFADLPHVTHSIGNDSVASLTNTAGDFILSGGTLNVGRLLNSSQINWTGGALVLNDGSATLTNASGAAITIAANGQRLTGTGGTLTNAGSVLVQGGAGTAIIDVALSNSGSVLVSQGTLSLNGGGSSNGALLQTGTNGTLQFGAPALGAASTFTITGGQYSALNTSISGGTLDVSAASSVFFVHSLHLTAGALRLGAQNAAAQGGLLQTGGTGSGPILTGSGTLSVFNGGLLTGGVESGTGTTRLNGTSQLGGGAALDGGRTLENDGWVNWSSGDILLGTGDAAVATHAGAVTNAANATFYVTANARMANLGDGTSRFSNLGVTAIYAGAGETDIDAYLANTGYLQVQSGTFSLNGGGSSDGGHLIGTLGGIVQFGTQAGGKAGGVFSVTGGQYAANITAISGGTLDVSAASGAIFVNQLKVTAGALQLGASSNAQVQGALLQSGGLLTGSSMLTAYKGASLTGGVQSGGGTTKLLGTSVLGGAFQVDGGRTLENDGWLNWSTASVTLGAGDATAATHTGTLTNAANATFYITANGRIANQGTGSSRLNNLGVTAVFAGGGETDIDAFLANTGFIQAQTGTLSLNGGGTSDGQHLFATANAVLQFGTQAAGAAGGVFSITGSQYTASYTAITGGTLDVSAASGAVFVNQLTLIAGALQLGALGSGQVQGALQQTGGRLTGTGTFKVSGGAALMGGVQSGAGTTQLFGTSAIGGTVTLDGGRTVENHGWINWSSGNIALGSGDPTALTHSGTLDNLAGTTFYVTADGRISGSGAVNNAGVIAVYSGSGETDIDATLNNTGGLQVQSGSLSLNGGGTISAGAVFVAQTAVLQFGTAATTGLGGAFTLTGGPYIAANTVVQAGTVDMSAVAGISFGNALSVNGGTLLLGSNFPNVANFSQSGGVLSGTGFLKVAGAALLSGGLETGSGRIVLKQGGVISGALQFDGGRSLENDGVLRWAGGSITMGAGDASTSTHAATLYNVAGAVLDIQSDGTVSSPGSGVISNAGTIIKSGGVGTTLLAPSLFQSGTMEAESGKLVLGGSVSGTGTFLLNGSATLEFTKAVVGSETMSFLHPGGTLAVDVTGTFGAIVSGFASGEILDATPVSAASAVKSFNNGTLTVSDGSHSIAFQLNGTYSAAAFHLASDAHGGTAVSYG